MCTHEIGDAYRRESRRLHPDRMSSLGKAEATKQANAIYSLVNEAYRVLKDPEQRGQYDQLLAGGIIRMTDDARSGASDQKRANDPSNAAKHPKAEKYWSMALSDWEQKSYRLRDEHPVRTQLSRTTRCSKRVHKAKAARDEDESKREEPQASSDVARWRLPPHQPVAGPVRRSALARTTEPAGSPPGLPAQWGRAPAVG